MKLNKNILASAVAASVVAMSGVQSANAEIELGAGMSVTGFLDMSYLYTDIDGAASTDKVFGIDQFEVDFMYAGSNGVSAQVDIQYGESGDGDGQDETFVEQAFITKQVTDTFSVKAGRFLSYSGWETAEPTGLYQYSAAGYGEYFYGGYQQGVSGMYDGEKVDFMVSFVNSAFDPIENDTTTIATEVGVAIQPVEGWTAKLFYITDDDNDIVNFWTSYEVSDFTLAFEYNMADYADDSEGDGYLLMANYAMGDFGFTVRYHDFTIDDAAGDTTMENSAITLAPSYVIGDNLLIVAEYRMDEWGDVDGDSFALEALFTF